MVRLFAVLILGMSIHELANSNSGLTRGKAQMPPHEQPPTSPWIKTPRAEVAGGFAHCGPWVRDGYKSIHVNVDARGCNIVGDAANEPSIAVDTTNPRKIVIGWRQFDSVASDFRQAGWAYSHDGGHTWVFPGSLTPGVFGSDPVLAANQDGAMFYLSINFHEMRLFRSYDAGLTWTEPVHVVDDFYDKPWMTIDPTRGSGCGNIYITGPLSVFLRSTDEGRTFTRSSEGLLGSGFTLTVGPYGEVYIVLGSGPFTAVTKSVNAADPTADASFEIAAGFVVVGEYAAVTRPNPGGLVDQPWIATDHSAGPTRGNVYILSTVGTDPEIGDPSDVVFLRSSNAGITWTAPLRVNNDPWDASSHQWFAMMSVAPNGRIDVVWNDTRNSQQPNLSEVFYSYSVDAGRTWSPNVPVSPMFDSWIGYPGGNGKLGDYYHMVSDNLGANLAYAATFNGEQDVYFLRIGPWDCNGNEVADENDISSGTSLDCNANGVPDECEYRADLDGDGLTTLTDHAAFASKMTGPGQAGISGCDALLDADHDGDIDLADFYDLQRVFAGP